MTKAQMVSAIEMTGKVIDFDRKYLMRKDRAYLERLLNTVTKG
jgi:hypothetical protein